MSYDNNCVYLECLPDISLDDLTDVVLTNPILPYQLLTYDGTYWINAFNNGSNCIYLDDLCDVTLTNPVVDQVLTFNGTDWINANSSSGALDDLTDVILTNPVVDQVLTFNGTYWINADSTVTNLALYDLTDVCSDVATPSLFDYLVFDGTEWCNRPDGMVNGLRNTSGGLSSFQGTTSSDNTAWGFRALTNVTTGNRNTAIGSNTLTSNIVGNQCTAVGNEALRYNTANSNSAFGFNALRVNTTGTLCTALGNASLSANTTGSENTAVGNAAQRYNTTASGNTAVGHNSSRNNTTGALNSAFGHSSLSANTTFGGITAIGANSQATASNQFIVATNNSNKLVTTFTEATGVFGGQRLMNFTFNGTDCKLPLYDVTNTDIPLIELKQPEALNQLIEYDGTTWTNLDGSSFVCDNLAHCSIGDLGDVNTSGVVTGDVLSYNGTEWVTSATDPINSTYPIIGNGLLINPIRLTDGNLRSEHIRWDGTQWQIRQSPFDAIIASTDGDFTTIEDAINAGCTRLAILTNTTQLTTCNLQSDTYIRLFNVELSNSPLTNAINLNNYNLTIEGTGEIIWNGSTNVNTVGYYANNGTSIGSTLNMNNITFSIANNLGSQPRYITNANQQLSNMTLIPPNNTNNSLIVASNGTNQTTTQLSNCIFNTNDTTGTIIQCLNTGKLEAVNCQFNGSLNDTTNHIVLYSDTILNNTITDDNLNILVNNGTNSSINISNLNSTLPTNINITNSHHINIHNSQLKGNITSSNCDTLNVNNCTIDNTNLACDLSRFTNNHFNGTTLFNGNKLIIGTNHFNGSNCVVDGNYTIISNNFCESSITLVPASDSNIISNNLTQFPINTTGTINTIVIGNLDY